MRPYYAASPMRRLDEFVLRARFDPTRLPDTIWALEGMPFRKVDEGVPSERHWTTRCPTSIGR